MAVERWRKTERMISALDAYTSEFQPSGSKITDYSRPSLQEEAIATEFAKELYELGEEIREKNDRYRAIREWQYRYHRRYPMADMVMYRPPAKEPKKPKVTKPNEPSLLTVDGPEVVLTQAELKNGTYAVETEYVDVTTFGSPKPEYLSTGNTLKLDGNEIGKVLKVNHGPEGISITAKITSPEFYSDLTKGWSAKKSLTVDDVKEAYDSLKDTLTKPISQKGDYDTLKALLSTKIITNSQKDLTFIGTTGGSSEDWYNKMVNTPKDGLFKKKSGK